MLASEETSEDDARYVLRWIQPHAPREFTKRDAQQHGKRRFPKADLVAMLRPAPDLAPSTKPTRRGLGGERRIRTRRKRRA